MRLHYHSIAFFKFDLYTAQVFVIISDRCKRRPNVHPETYDFYIRPTSYFFVGQHVANMGYLNSYAYVHGRYIMHIYAAAISVVVIIVFSQLTFFKTSSIPIKVLIIIQ